LIIVDKFLEICKEQYNKDYKTAFLLQDINIKLHKIMVIGHRLYCYRFKKLEKKHAHVLDNNGQSCFVRRDLQYLIMTSS
jgi:hypothetical protein